MRNDIAYLEKSIIITYDNIAIMKIIKDISNITLSRILVYEFDFELSRSVVSVAQWLEH